MLTDKLPEIWEQTLQIVEKHMTKPSFETWLKPTKPVELNEDGLIVEVPNEFARDWVESRYAPLLSSTLRDILQNDLSIKFVTPKGQVSEEQRLPVQENLYCLRGFFLPKPQPKIYF